MIHDNYDEIVVRRAHNGRKRRAHIPFEDSEKPMCAVVNVSYGKTKAGDWKRTSSRTYPEPFTVDCKRCLRIENDSESV